MAWYNANWQYRVKITIDNTKVPGNLTDFPVLITEDNIPSAFWGHVKNDGTDIVITQSDEITKLKRELVSIDTVGEKLELWTKTDLSGSADTDIYMYYGYAGASETNDTDTWDSDFIMVQHMNDDPDTSHTQDSTSNNNDGTKKGTNEPVETTGKWVSSKGQEFDGGATADDRLNCGKQSSINNIDVFTIEVWAKRYSSGEGGAGRIYDKNDHIFLGSSDPNGKLSFSARRWTTNNGGWQTPSGSISDDAWYYIVVRYDYGSTSNDPTILLNNINQSLTEYNTPSGSVGSDAASDFLIGDEYYAGRTFDGIMDEFRISDVERSDDWIETCYNNQNSPSTFYSVGSEEGGSTVFVDVKPTGGSPGIGKKIRDGINNRWLWQTKHATDPDFITRGYIDSSGFHDGSPP